MQSKNAMGNLKNRYAAVLKKCNLLNTFGSLAVLCALTLTAPTAFAAAAGAAGANAHANSSNMVNGVISATGGDASGFDDDVSSATPGDGYVGGTASATGTIHTNTQTYAVQAFGGKGSDGGVAGGYWLGSGGSGGNAEASGIQTVEAVNNSGTITVTAIGGNGGNGGGDGLTASTGIANGGYGGGAEALGIQSLEAMTNSGKITVTATGGNGGNGGDASSVSIGTADGGNGGFARAIGMYSQSENAAINNSGTITASATGGQGGQGGQTLSGPGNAGFTRTAAAYGIYSSEKNGNINNTGTINVSNTYEAVGIQAGDNTDVSGSIVNNRGFINIKGVADANALAYGIGTSISTGSSGYVTINNAGWINVDTTATHSAEVHVEQGTTYVDTYATNLRDYATYGNVFDVQQGGALHFNNTTFLARPGIGLGFVYGQEYAVADMVDNPGSADAVTGAITSVVTDISLLRATLTGTGASNQSIALYTNVNSNNNVNLQNSLNQLNNLLNKNDKLGVQQFLSNNKDLFKDVAKDLSPLELLQLKQEVQTLVNNTPYLKELIASLDEKEAVTGTPSIYEGDPVTGTPSIYEGDPVTGTPQYQEAAPEPPAPDYYETYSQELQQELASLKAAQDEMLVQLDAYKALRKKIDFAGLLIAQLGDTVLSGNASVLQVVLFQRAIEIQLSGTLDDELATMTSLFLDSIATLQSAFSRASAAAKNTEEFKAVIEQFSAAMAYYDNPVNVFEPYTANTGTNSGSHMQDVERQDVVAQDVVVSGFVNAFVDEAVAPNLSAADMSAISRGQLAPKWSVNISPYGSANNADTSDGSSYGVSGGVSRIFNEKFKLGMHFDVNYSSSNADNLSTDTDVMTTSLGLNANYNINENWYVGGQITGAISQTESDYETGSLLLFQANDKYDGYSVTAALNTGYLFKINKNNAISPEIGLSYVHQHTDKNAIEWNNNGSYMNIYNDSIEYNALYGTLNLRWLGSFALDNGSTINPFVAVGIRQNLSGNAMESGMTFLDTRFITESTPDLTTFTTSAGLEWVYGDFSVSANYNGAFGEDNQNHGGSLNFSYSF